ncbi:DegT/DnrJ/EryC1/StrS family aminotransferase [bacterium]|nr:DegT/DnrJ/EryC1/StrS family aminotransferase [candidate division CSSED10-310 bacterium]
MTIDTLPAVAGGKPVRSGFLNFARAWIGEEEISEVVETLKSGWLTTGPRTKQFEKQLAEYLQVKHVVCLNSCTSALHLALILLDIGPGDEVITSPITFPATANVVLHRGAEIRFADVDAGTLNLDMRSVRDRITKATKAVIPVHMAGQPCDMDALESLCRQHELFIVQDSAHAIESRWNGKPLAQYGDLSAYSFYATKNITCGEGGALAGNNPEIMERALTLSIFGISKDAWKRYNMPGYQHWETIEPGYKYNMFDIQAAIGLRQLEKINGFAQRRTEIAARYDAAFRDHPGLIPVITLPEAHHAHYIYILQLNPDNLKIDRNLFMQALEKENIGIGIHFRSLLAQHYYRNRYPEQVPLCPNAARVSERILSIPLYPLLSDQDVDTIIAAVLKLLDYYIK